VLPLMESDLLEVMLATTNGTLYETDVVFSDKHACCVVMASEGYPQKYDTGKKLDIEPAVRDNVYVAGAKLKDGELVTAGGRVLGAVAVADTLPEAVADAYALTRHIHFDNAYMRSDIGKRALAAKEE